LVRDCKKLLDQMAVGAMDFDAVESDLHRVACGLLECLDDAWDFACFQRARRLVGHDLAVGVMVLNSRGIGTADGATGSTPPG
jgi:hypothetical protein